MRKVIFLFLFVAVGLGINQAMFLGHVDDPQVQHFEPVFLSWKEFRSSIRSEAPKPIAKRGKIAIRGDHLFINEPNAGIHVFDNRDPAAPVAVAFLKIPGNVDLAVKGQILFVDSFVDLVALDLSDLSEVKELNRQVDVFPYDPYQTGDGQVWYSGEIDKTKGVVVGWNKTRGSK